MWKWRWSKGVRKLTEIGVDKVKKAHSGGFKTKKSQADRIVQTFRPFSPQISTAKKIRFKIVIRRKLFMTFLLRRFILEQRLSFFSLIMFFRFRWKILFIRLPSRLFGCFIHLDSIWIVSEWLFKFSVNFSHASRNSSKTGRSKLIFNDFKSKRMPESL